MLVLIGRMQGRSQKGVRSENGTCCYGKQLFLRLREKQDRTCDFCLMISSHSSNDKRELAGEGISRFQAPGKCDSSMINYI